jgi:hypothetical protein
MHSIICPFLLSNTGEEDMEEEGSLEISECQFGPPIIFGQNQAKSAPIAGLTVDG